MNTFGRAPLPEPRWICASQPFSPPNVQPGSSHLPAGNFWEQLVVIHVAWRFCWCNFGSFLPLMALQDKGWEGFSSCSLLFCRHWPSLSIPCSSLVLWPFLCSGVAERWCPEQQSWSWQALGFCKARDVSRGVGLGKTKGILSSSTVDAAGLHFECCQPVVSLLPAKWH